VNELIDGLIDLTRSGASPKLNSGVDLPLPFRDPLSRDGVSEGKGPIFTIEFRFLDFINSFDHGSGKISNVA